jgi:hypothetical protein
MKRSLFTTLHITSSGLTPLEINSGSMKLTNTSMPSSVQLFSSKKNLTSEGFILLLSKNMTSSTSLYTFRADSGIICLPFIESGLSSFLRKSGLINFWLNLITMMPFLLIFLIVNVIGLVKIFLTNFLFLFFKFI